ncbi:MAG: hypothetical protein IAF38_18040 [Bacteroidia bacterium]|nr:hypothetical protein [Bacteroidia bacterium]
MKTNLKLITALTGLSVVLSFTGKAQFSAVPTSTTNIYNTNTGFVGIGTGSVTAATEKLQVKGGNILLDPWASSPGANGTGNLFFGGVTSAGPAMRLSFAASSNGYIDARTSTATTGLSFRVDNSSGGTERLRINANGNVGIGNSNPLFKLEVAGTGKFSSNLTIGAYILPAVDGTANQFLSTNGAGVVTWKSSTALAWGITGNSGTTASTAAIGSTVNNNFIGTTDAKNLIVATNNLERMRITSAGNMGINYATPTEKFQIDNGVLKLSSPNAYGGPMMLFAASPTAGYVGDWGIEYVPTGTRGLNFWKPFGSPNGGNNYLFLADDGHVGVNTNNPTGQLTVNGKTLIGDPGLAGFMGLPGTYLLYVQQGILTEKVKVAVCTSVDWADYVFDSNYKLKSLNEVETFVAANKHLPNIPSAEEMVKEGNDLGKMDAKLLEKIEELTLYLIQQNKKMEEIQKEITILKSK